MAAAPEQHAAAHGLGGAHEQGLQASRAVAVSKVRQPDAPATVQTPAAVAPEAPAAPAPAAGGTAGEERHSSFRHVCRLARFWLVLSHTAICAAMWCSVQSRVLVLCCTTGVL